MSLADAELLAMQAPLGVPRSTVFETVSDPLVPSNATSTMLAHFFDEVYDLSSTSHLTRLLNVLLGDSGAGQLRKRYTYAHLSSVLMTTHYNDLDQLYGSVFGLKRFIRERISLDAYNQAATDAEWEAITVADASYRSRIEAFSHAIARAGTPDGMIMAANAVLGTECRIYESYDFLDNVEVYAPVVDPSSKTWGDLEQFSYGDLDGQTYGSLEGKQIFQGRSSGSRGEFIIRPLRSVSDEERYHLNQTLTRLKPAESLMTIDTRESALYTAVPVFRATASSSYWHVQARVQPVPENGTYYDKYSPNEAMEQPRLAFSQYQGESWDYNSDVIGVRSTVEDENGVEVANVNYSRLVDDSTGAVVDYPPELALMDAHEVALSRSMVDGVVVSPVAERNVST